MFRLIYIRVFVIILLGVITVKIIVCLDDNKGMMFNNRRQSRDKEVYADIIKSFECIGVSPYSASLFAEFNDKIKVSDKLSAQNTYFIEDMNIEAFYNEIDEIIIYRWNRVYPADRYFNIDLSHYSLISSNDFTGISHDKITKEIYKRQVK